MLLARLSPARRRLGDDRRQGPADDPGRRAGRHGSVMSGPAPICSRPRCATIWPTACASGLVKPRDMTTTRRRSAARALAGRKRRAPAIWLSTPRPTGSTARRSAVTERPHADRRDDRRAGDRRPVRGAVPVRPARHYRPQGAARYRRRHPQGARGPAGPHGRRSRARGAGRDLRPRRATTTMRRSRKTCCSARRSGRPSTSTRLAENALCAERARQASA